ncbi:MAG: hypothetical protein JNL83_15640 [Myxococcales bacterium]|nr:hypothetical protein [Myxococcales bacterium]
MVRRVLVVFGILALLAGPALAEKLTVYTWQGFGTGSNLHNPKFTPRWNAVIGGKKDATIVDKKPSPERMLEQFSKAHIIYGSTHSGIPKGSPAEQGLQIGDKGDARYVLFAREIAPAKSKAQLVIINGCSTFPLIDESDGKVRNMATAFGISKSTKGRAFIGFVGVHPGPKGDSFFRVFFYFWMGAGGKDLTIRQALDQAKQFIIDQVAKQGGDKAQEFFLSTGAANIYDAEDLVVLGDDQLRYRDLKP